MTHAPIQEKVAALFGTEFMREVVLRQYEQLDVETVLDIVAGAPVSLTRKLATLTELAENDERFCQAKETAEAAVNTLRQGRQERLTVRAYRLIGRDSVWDGDPFVRYPSLREAVRRTRGAAASSPDSDWYQVEEAWRLGVYARWPATTFWLDPRGEPAYFEIGKRSPDGDHRSDTTWDRWLSFRDFTRRTYDSLVLPLEVGDVVKTDGLPRQPRVRGTICEVDVPGKASLLSVQIRWHTGKPPWRVPLFCSLDTWPPAYPVSPLYGLVKVPVGD